MRHAGLVVHAGLPRARAAEFRHLRRLLLAQVLRQTLQLGKLRLGRIEIAFARQVGGRGQQCIRLFPPYLVAVGHGLLDLRQQPVHVLARLYALGLDARQQPTRALILLGLERRLGLIVIPVEQGKFLFDRGQRAGELAPVPEPEFGLQFPGLLQGIFRPEVVPVVIRGESLLDQFAGLFLPGAPDMLQLDDLLRLEEVLDVLHLGQSLRGKVVAALVAQFPGFLEDGSGLAFLFQVVCVFLSGQLLLALAEHLAGFLDLLFGEDILPVLNRLEQFHGCRVIARAKPFLSVYERLSDVLGSKPRRGASEQLHGSSYEDHEQGQVEFPGWLHDHSSNVMSMLRAKMPAGPV